ncbi:MAG TPA: hypothetical protein PKD05_04335 [Candidatus Melainabacteria bacterium]|nr:hypothetical protein [Candidatus Melainabacteria bacterium]
MASKTKIQTGFIAKQAAESSKRGTNRGVILFIAVVAVGALLFGGWKAVEMLLNFQNYTNIRNVTLQLNAPQLKDGKAFVDVTLHNANAYAISEPVFKFDLADASGKEVLRGEIKIDGNIPAADQRTCKNAFGSGASRCHNAQRVAFRLRLSLLFGDDI